VEVGLILELKNFKRLEIRYGIFSNKNSKSKDMIRLGKILR